MKAQTTQLISDAALLYKIFFYNKSNMRHKLQKLQFSLIKTLKMNNSSITELSGCTSAVIYGYGFHGLPQVEKQPNRAPQT